MVVDKTNFQIIQNENSKKNDYFFEIEKIWNNFLNKQEKRDLVILYRNPYEHFISGFIQDWITKPITIESEPYINYFINSLPGSFIQKNKFFEMYCCSQNGLNYDLINDYYEIAYNLIKMKLEFYVSKAKYGLGHYTPWLTFLQNLYYSNKIDTNKIKFFDIYDSPIELQLKNYIEEPFSNKKLDYYKINNYTINLIKTMMESDNTFLVHRNMLLGNEMDFYTKIKTNNL